MRCSCWLEVPSLAAQNAGTSAGCSQLQGPASETTAAWSIDTASGSSSFSVGVTTSNADASVVANLNADRLDGKQAFDFITAPVAPASKHSHCSQARWAFDNNFVYLCVATNTWQRAALSSW